MVPAFDKLRDELKKLPGIGFRAAERITFHLLVEHPEAIKNLVLSIADATEKIGTCPICGNIAEKGENCDICSNEARSQSCICIVEHIQDIIAIERSGTFSGKYHVLHGHLSPIRGITIDKINFTSLLERLKTNTISEIILALSNDIEGEATCLYIKETIKKDFPNINISRIGFGLPSGGSLNYADPATLKNALDARRNF